MLEIERKFLVTSNRWLALVSEQVELVQGYLADTPHTIRVRINQGEQKAWLTIKTQGLRSREEIEFEMPMAEAKEALAISYNQIKKTRFIVVDSYAQRWEVDVFADKLNGLVLAEIELESETENVILPDWIGTEVTDDRRYSNVRLGQLNSLADLAD